MKNNIPNDAKQLITEVERSLFSEETMTNQTNQENFRFDRLQNDSAIISKIKQLYIKVLKLTFADMYDRLTRREIEIIQLICNGNTTDEIANILNLSSHTVESHRSNIFSKLDVRNVAELVALAFRVGMVE